MHLNSLYVIFVVKVKLTWHKTIFMWIVQWHLALTVLCNHHLFPGGPVVKNLPANTGDKGLIPGPGRFHMLWGN